MHDLRNEKQLRSTQDICCCCFTRVVDQYIDADIFCRYLAFVYYQHQPIIYLADKCQKRNFYIDCAEKVSLLFKGTLSYWNTLLNGKVICWHKAWLLLQKFYITNKVKEIYFKLVHRFYPDNHYLQCKKTPINLNCTFILALYLFYYIVV